MNDTERLAIAKTLAFHAKYNMPLEAYIVLCNHMAKAFPFTKEVDRDRWLRSCGIDIPVKIRRSAY